jgi:hypothetical protein
VIVKPRAFIILQGDKVWDSRTISERKKHSVTVNQAVSQKQKKTHGISRISCIDKNNEISM